MTSHGIALISELNEACQLASVIVSEVRKCPSGADMQAHMSFINFWFSRHWSNG